VKLTTFLRKHSACTDGADWAIATGCETIEEIWLREDLKPEWRIWIVTQEGVLTDKQLRLFACRCVREAWHLLTDPRSREAVEVAERFANGEAMKEELAAAKAAAEAAAWEAAKAAAEAAKAAAKAAAEAAKAAAWEAAEVAEAAAMAAAWATAEVAEAAAMAAAWATAEAVQAKILIELVPAITVDEVAK
jgi:hypothetical protein